MFKNFGNDTKEGDRMVIVNLFLVTTRLEHWCNNNIMCFPVKWKHLLG